MAQATIIIKGVQMKKIFLTAGYSSIFLGTGRKEFNPKKPMPSFEAYLQESAKGVISQLGNANFDEGVISNFMAGRFIKQGNLPGFLPFAIPELTYKPCSRVEGACGSGGLALASAIKSVLSDSANSVYVTGFEIQNIVKAVYGADYLAGAAYFNGERKNGHAHFFPNIFSQRAGAYANKFGKENMRNGLAQWYVNAIENARTHPKAQEYHNQNQDLMRFGLSEPNPHIFLDHLNFADCSKISDGASSIVVCDEEGLKKIGAKKEDAIELVAFAQAEGNIVAEPKDAVVMDTTEAIAKKCFEKAKMTIKDIGMLELHDCFTISGLLALEALGFCKTGQGWQVVSEGKTKRNAELPVNTSGGLIGFGHPTGATGVRQMVDIWEQLTGKASSPIKAKNNTGMMISMGGNDKTLSAFILKKA